jgi:hypothetical protein
MLLNNTILLVTLTNFEPNLALVNINKLKPYQFIASYMKILRLKNHFTRRNHRPHIDHQEESKRIMI